MQTLSVFANRCWKIQAHVQSISKELTMSILTRQVLKCSHTYLCFCFCRNLNRSEALLQTQNFASFLLANKASIIDKLNKGYFGSAKNTLKHLDLGHVRV